MRKWNVLRAPTIAWTPRIVYAKQTTCSLQHYRPYYRDGRDTTRILKPAYAQLHNTVTGLPQYAVFSRVDAPKRNLDDWLALLDGALPLHLREWRTTPPSLSAIDVAEVLLAAQYPTNLKDPAFDLLFHLGFKKERWNAVVWLIKRLVEKFPVRHGQTSRFADVNALWKISPSLEDATEPRASVQARNEPFALQETPSDVASVRATSTSLDELTGDDEHFAPQGKLQHNALGQIWRTLGTMTKACAGGDIRPEVLEIIAYLHHKEVMPMSIYRAEPHPDPSAVQQPPLLSLLSSRILTSLSDAAWRAHEKLVIEEEKAQGARYAGVRPEVPGSVYRVHVAGLRTEVWMELILWSCIHGGWIDQGAAILRTIVADRAWTAISWREHARSMYADDHFDESWEYAFKTRASSSMDAPPGGPFRVDRTVSAEVVNAYIDAVACAEHPTDSGHGPSIESTIEVLQKFKKLLFRSESRLSISTGTWDALILRLLDAQGVPLEANAAAAQGLVELSPGFGQGLEVENTQDLPSYVLDGGMAMQGFLHRVLYGQIASGNYEGAVAAFRRIQTRADRDKQTSLKSFMQGQKPLMKALSDDDLFTSNLSGIEYPAFDVQIPAGILGSFLDLVTTCKDQDLGRWLLYNNDLDGPLIQPRMYHDPSIEPAVIRFAAEFNDRNLLARFKDQKLHFRSLQAVLDTQIEALRWQAATRILQVLGTRRRSWRPSNLARVIRVMLQQARLLATGQDGAAEDFGAAKTMLSDMCTSRYHDRTNTTKSHEVKVRNLLVVLAAVDESLAAICIRLMQTTHRRYDDFMLDANTFNIVLGGVVNAYGSVAGRRLLERFWPYVPRTPHDTTSQLSRARGGMVGKPRSRPVAHDSVNRHRIAVRVDTGTADKQELVVYGALCPNSETILMILRKALAELRPKQQETTPVADSAVSTHDRDASGKHVHLTPAGMVAWGVRRLAELPYVENSIIDQIDGVLAAHDMQGLRKQLSEIVQGVERDIIADDEEESAAVQTPKPDEPG